MTQKGKIIPAALFLVGGVMMASLFLWQTYAGSPNTNANTQICSYSSLRSYVNGTAIGEQFDCSMYGTDPNSNMSIIFPVSFTGSYLNGSQYQWWCGRDNNPNSNSYPNYASVNGGSWWASCPPTYDPNPPSYSCPTSFTLSPCGSEYSFDFTTNEYSNCYYSYDGSMYYPLYSYGAPIGYPYSYLGALHHQGYVPSSYSSVYIYCKDMVLNTGSTLNCPVITSSGGGGSLPGQIPPTTVYTHKTCQNGQCVTVSGMGLDECSDVLQCPAVTNQNYNGGAGVGTQEQSPWWELYHGSATGLGITNMNNAWYNPHLITNNQPLTFTSGYYWRVDEVNENSSVIEGNLWMADPNSNAFYAPPTSYPWSSESADPNANVSNNYWYPQGARDRYNTYISYFNHGTSLWEPRIAWRSNGNMNHSHWLSLGDPNSNNTYTPPTITSSPSGNYTYVLFGEKNANDPNANGDIAIFRASNDLWSVRNINHLYLGSSNANTSVTPSDNFNSDFSAFRSSQGLWAIRGIGTLNFNNNFGSGYYWRVDEVHDNIGAATDDSGDIYAAWQRTNDDPNSNSVIDVGVFRPSQGLWSVRQLNTNSILPSNPAITYGNSGDPIVVWQGGTESSSDIYVSRWDGTNWVQMGSGNISNTNSVSRNPSIIRGLDGNPIVAWEDNADGDYDIYVRRWDGTNWVEVGTGSATGGGISSNTGNSTHPYIAIQPDGRIFASWLDDSSGSNQIYIRGYTQTTEIFPFGDVPSTHWGYNYIYNLWQHCPQIGYRDANGQFTGEYKPDSPITRADLTSLLVLCQNETLSLKQHLLAAAGLSDLFSVTSFPDVDINAWYYPYVMEALNKGWIEGYPDGTFRPNDNTIRVEALKVMLLSKFVPEEIVGGVMDFLDTITGQWYEKYVAFAVLKGFVNGYKDALGNLTGYFGPANNMTRAEASKIISIIYGFYP